MFLRVNSQLLLTAFKSTAGTRFISAKWRNRRAIGCEAWLWIERIPVLGANAFLARITDIYGYLVILLIIDAVELAHHCWS